VEADAVLARRDAEREAAARELKEARDQADLRTVEIADLEARLQAEAAERARVEARCRELEAEVARLAEASEALESIEAMMTKGG
jgi:chromosome segregation ATPase